LYLTKVFQISRRKIGEPLDKRILKRYTNNILLTAIDFKSLILFKRGLGAFKNCEKIINLTSK